jgi:hypothetical protein
MTNDQIIAILYANTTCAEDINACTNLDWICKFARALLATQAIPVPQNGDEQEAFELAYIPEERLAGYKLVPTELADSIIDLILGVDKDIGHLRASLRGTYRDAVAKAPAPQNIYERRVSGLELAVIGRKHFGNPIPKAWYAAARELYAALAANNAAAGGETDINTALEQAAKALEKSGMRDDSRIVRGMKPGYPPTARGKLIAAHGASQDGDEPEKGILSEKELLVLWDQSTDEVEGPSRVDGSMTAWILAYGRAVREAVLASNKDGDERARFEAWFATNKEHAYGWSPRYAALEAWQAALASNKAAAEVVGELYVKLFRPSTGDVFKALRTDSAGIGDLLREGWEISATPPAPIASAEEADVEVHVHLTKGGLEVSEPVVKFSKAFESRMDAEPGKVFKLYTHPAAVQPSREEVLEEAAQHIDHHVRDLGSEFAKALCALKDKP